MLEIGRDMTGQRRSQVIAQRQPLAVIILERKDAFIGPVHIRQELAQRIGIFKSRCFQRREAIAFIDPPHRFQHGALSSDFRRAAVAKTTGQPRFGSVLFGLGHGGICLESQGFVMGPGPAGKEAARLPVNNRSVKDLWQKRLLPEPGYPGVDSALQYGGIGWPAKFIPTPKRRWTA